MSAYARLVAKHRRLVEAAEAQVHPALALALLPGARAALEAVEAAGRDPRLAATAGGHLTTVYGAAAIRHARELAARTLAAMELGNATPCPHLEGVLVPPGLVYVLLSYRRLACEGCMQALLATGPDPADDDRCDWCGTRGVTWFHPVLAPLGPCVVSGAACRSCFAALVPGGDLRPRGRG